MTSTLFRFLLAVALAASWPATDAVAAPSYDGCAGTIASLPAVITTQGTWCLDADLATGMASGIAIEIRANNVTLDCNGFKVGGLAAGVSTQTYGVSSAKLNTVVRDCNIRGFHTGINLQAEGGLVEDSRLEANRAMAIYAESGAIIRRNVVLDTGGSPTAFVYAIVAIGNTEVSDNRVEVTISGNGSVTRGIYGANADGLVFRDNIIIGISGGPGGAPSPLSVQSGTRAVVTGNFVSTAAPGGSVGIGCPSSSLTILRDNTVIGPNGEDPDCTDAGGNWFN